MLAQNFKTPADLRIGKAKFNALKALLGMLERGEIPHHPTPDDRCPIVSGFNLAEWRCGSAACIGGLAETISNVKFGQCDKLSTKLRHLFYPDTYGPAQLTFDQMKAATPSQAAIALRNYLTHGEPRWAEALAD